MQYTEEEIVESIERMVDYFKLAVRYHSLDKVKDPVAENYTDWEVYLRDLRSRLSVASFYLIDLIVEYESLSKAYERKCTYKQAETQLKLQREFEDGENGRRKYSKSQSETHARKTTELDKDYVALQEEYDEYDVKFKHYTNLKWAVQNISNAMSNYGKTGGYE